MGEPVTLDMSTAQPIPTPVTLDMSTAQPIDAPKPRTWVDSATDAAKEWWKQVNPVSAVQGLAQAARHPIDTAVSLSQGQGMLAKRAEESFKKGDYAAGVQHFLNYLVPVIGQQTDQAGDLARQGEYAKAAGMTAGIATNIAAPELAKGITAKLPIGQLPERMYQSALKPSTTLSTERVQGVIRTGLENKIPVSADGVAKLDGLITDLSDRVKTEIQSGSKSGATIDPAAVAQRADQIKGKFANQVNPNADLQAIDSAKQEFLANNPNPIPAADAQTMKQGTYSQLKTKAYGEMKSATIESQKALARGIKEELENQFPEIKGLNAKQGQLIGLDDVLERAVRRIDNHQLFGIGTPIAAGAGAAVGGAPGAAAAGILKFILDNPEVKSKLAIKLSQATKGGSPISAATARVAAYSNALGSAMQNDSRTQSAP